MSSDSSSVLYQKIGVTISNVALSLLAKNAGDRIPPIATLEAEFGVSRGTIQNALKHLKEVGAVELKSHGHLGTFIETVDYKKLQENCLRQDLLGIMPLPYSLTYEGFATAIYEQLKNFKFNMAYARGAEGRIKLVGSGTYQFAVCSQYAAECAIRQGRNIEIVMNFGGGSFLSKHVLLLREAGLQEISDGMRVAYDADSIDQSGITRDLIEGKKVKLVDIRTQQTLSALTDGIIDAGVWNYDDIAENHHLGDVNVVSLNEMYDTRFSTAVMVIQKGDLYLRDFLKKNISRKYTLKILKEVRNHERRPYF